MNVTYQKHVLTFCLKVPLLPHAWCGSASLGLRPPTNNPQRCMAYSLPVKKHDIDSYVSDATYFMLHDVANVYPNICSSGTPCRTNSQSFSK